MNKEQATEQVDKFRDMKLRCRVNSFDATLETCTGREKELSLNLTFKFGRLKSISGEDKFSPFGAFTVPFIQNNGQPDVRTEGDLRWGYTSDEDVKKGAKDGLETMNVYLYHGNANFEIVRWGKLQPQETSR